MHREDGRANVDCSETNLGHERADWLTSRPDQLRNREGGKGIKGGRKRTGRSATHVVPDQVLLQRHLGLGCDSPQREDGLRSGRVTLLRVGLDRDAGVDQRAVVLLVLVDKARVNRVADVGPVTSQTSVRLVESVCEAP